MQENNNSKRRSNYLLAGLCIIIVAAVFLSIGTGLVMAQQPDTGLNFAANLELPQTSEDPRIVIINIVRYLLTFIGIIAVFMIIYSGYLWTVSGGSPDKIARAKRVLINSMIGLLITVAALAIVTFIMQFIEDSLQGTLGGGVAPPPSVIGIVVIGSCSVEGVYPEDGQIDVPRNYPIVVTFKEEINPNTLCNDTNGNGACDPGEYVIPANVRLYVSNNGDGCVTDPINCSGNIVDVNVSVTPDYRTVTFSPVNYLGSPSEYIWYSVYLSNNITRRSDGTGIFSNCRSDYLLWQFQVNNQLDITPPQVMSVFPAPDNSQDTLTSTVAVQALGAITVASQPTGGQPAQLLSAAKNPTSGAWEDISATIDPNNTYTRVVTATVIDDLSGQVQFQDGAILLGTEFFSGSTITLPNYFAFTVLGSGTYSNGNSWNIDITGRVQADTLTVGTITYDFVAGAPTGNEIQVGATAAGTAANIAAALATHPAVEVFPAYSPGNTTVDLRARTAGSGGNNISLLSSSPSNIQLTPMSGGADGGQVVTVVGQRDQPKNAIIQINFNEPVNPMTLSGDAASLSGWLRVVDLTAGGGNLTGKFVMSNQYSTVEFIPDNLCGVNGCGEQIFCLPGLHNLRVEIEAAALEDCSIGCSTRSPYTSCVSGHCANPGTGEFLPLSNTPLNGVADLALNSLDGNRDGQASGPVSFYDENNPVPTDGDSYQWSFWTSDVLDLTPPVLSSTVPAAHNTTGVPLPDPVLLNFNKLMLGNSLKTGSYRTFNGQTWTTHQLINLWSYSGQTPGYWVVKNDIDIDSPPDGQGDETQAEIRHSEFADFTSFRVQIGSGVKDIYQNCFKPVTGPDCTGTPSQPSCCPSGGAVNPVDITGLDAQGNCK